MLKIGIVIIVLLIAGGVVLALLNRRSQSPEIANFDDCIVAGYPVAESYPARCTTPDGETFTQDIGNEMDYKDEILVHAPRPTQKITSPLRISGEARGPWFFEGSFSAELFDPNGQSLGTAILQAQGEWMSEEMVPFVGELTFTAPSGGKGTLMIHNANPSGLPENQKELRMPVSF